MSLVIGMCRAVLREDRPMSCDGKSTRSGKERRSGMERRTSYGERRVAQDPAWLGEKDRRVGPPCRRQCPDRRQGGDRRKS
jgi:hypothetical protein